MKTRIVKVVADAQMAEAAREGASALRAGRLVAFATETVYGVAAVANDAGAMERLRELKDRPARPFTVHIGRPADAWRYVRAETIGADAARLIDKAMPGPITLVLPTGGQLADPALADPALYERLVYKGAIGLRCPDSALAAAMLSAVDAPVVAPSANLAGATSPRSAEDVLAGLEGRIDLLIDSGPTRYGKDSTIVDFSSKPWKIVRQGVYDERMIRRFLRRSYVFVCTGNTCRSPMAAGIAKLLLARKLGIKTKDLARSGVEVSSAGVFASDGARATPEAIQAADDRGADISSHRSRRLTAELINSADLVFCMTRSHVEQVLQLAPHAAAKVRRLDEAADIPDPVGGGPDAYRQTAARIEQSLGRWLEKGLP